MGVTDELEQLRKLRDAGTLSEEEFAAAKAKVLGQEAKSGSGFPWKIVLIIVGVLVVVGIPMFGLAVTGSAMYLLRRPADEHEVTVAPVQGDENADATPTQSPARKAVEASVGPVEVIRCGDSSAAPASDCDRLPGVEESLVKAIKKGTDCAPKTGRDGTISFVLSVDVTRRRTDMTVGASSTWKGPQARRAAQCVARLMPDVSWDSLQAKEKFYQLKALAQYPAPAGPSATSFDEF